MYGQSRGKHWFEQGGTLSIVFFRAVTFIQAAAYVNSSQTGTVENCQECVNFSNGCCSTHGGIGGDFVSVCWCFVGWGWGG